MKRPALVLCALLGTAGVSHAALDLVEAAFELRPSQAALPADGDGEIRVQPCPTCAFESLTVNAGTRYILQPGTAQVTRAEFAADLVRLGSQPRAMLFVYYEPRSRVVHRLVLHPGR